MATSGFWSHITHLDPIRIMCHQLEDDTRMSHEDRSQPLASPKFPDEVRKILLRVFDILLHSIFGHNSSSTYFYSHIMNLANHSLSAEI